jgi:uncharacterized protein YcfJ
MKTSVPKIRSVRDKATGREIKVLRQYPQNDRKAINGRIQELMGNFFGADPGKGAGGFSFTIWDKEGASCTAVSCFSGATVHRSHVADFVRGCIDKNITRDW